MALFQYICSVRSSAERGVNYKFSGPFASKVVGAIPVFRISVAMRSGAVNITAAFDCSVWLCSSRQWNQCGQ